MNDGFATSDYHYDLPKELIAQHPLSDRAASRLMVLDKTSGTVSHHHFREIVSFLNAGDLLVMNDTKVLPVRLYGVKEDTGAKVEVLLLKEAKDFPDCRECLVRPGKKLRKGDRILFFQNRDDTEKNPDTERSNAPLMRAEIMDVCPDGNRIIRFFPAIQDERVRTLEEMLDLLGEMPLPPYITQKLENRDRYNTIYARHEGSAAAPTAGLHVTKDVLDALREKGVRIAYVTLHVGLGTFRPVKVKDVRKHQMHTEWYSIPEETARLVNETKARNGRVICVGTTSCRTLESAAHKDSLSADGPVVSACSGETAIFIYPGFDFLVMDGLITNFHLPESTLLMLVSAFATREQILFAYKEAVRERYRFFSFGDAMLIV